jgi:hypothetical protein
MKEMANMWDYERIIRSRVRIAMGSQAERLGERYGFAHSAKQRDWKD